MRWGIVGCGTVAQQFARDLLKVDGARLQGVASRSAGKAAAFAEEFKAARERNSELFLAVYNIGITYKMMGDKVNAKQWLQQFITGAGSKGTAELVKAAQDSMYQLDAP